MECFKVLFKPQITESTQEYFFLAFWNSHLMVHWLSSIVNPLVNSLTFQIPGINIGILNSSFFKGIFNVLFKVVSLMSPGILLTLTLISKAKCLLV